MSLTSYNDVRIAKISYCVSEHITYIDQQMNQYAQRNESRCMRRKYRDIAFD
jgi:hypothetical protein